MLLDDIDVTTNGTNIDEWKRQRLTAAQNYSLAIAAFMVLNQDQYEYFYPSAARE